jgi:hypothetical protein
MNALNTFIGVGDLFDTVSRVTTGTAGQTGAALLLLAVAVGLVVRGRRPVVRRATGTSLRPATIGRRWLIGIAAAAAVAVAGLGGIRSFQAVSATFGSPLVPLTADGMIIACTALRLAALTRGWRLPGSLATTYLFIGGTVWLNIAAAHGWTDAVAHALAPVSYAVLVEMLAHLLRLHLRLAQPSKPRVTALTWFTSPIVTTRVWLHLARTGGQDPVAARALVQQLIRMSSRLQTVCPSQPLRGWSPFDRPQAARAAALQTIRDGLLSAHELAALLPTDETQLPPGALLAVVDGAALRCTAPDTPLRRSASHRGRTSAPEPVHTDGTTDRTISAPRQPALTAPTAPTVSGPGLRSRDDRSDDELVAELHRHAEHNGGPVSQREVMRLLGVGTPKAKRLAVLAGWTEPSPAQRGSSKPVNDAPEQAAGQLALVSAPGQHDEHDTTHTDTDTAAETDSDVHARNSR